MLKVQLLDAWWRGWNRLWFAMPGDAAWPWGLRCRGYRQCGLDDEGWRTHMAQYCLRLRGHRGLCLAKVSYSGVSEPSEFEPERPPSPRGDEPEQVILAARTVWQDIVEARQREDERRSAELESALRGLEGKDWKPSAVAPLAPLFAPGVADRLDEKLMDAHPIEECYCPTMNKPPCSNCENGTTDPDDPRGGSQ